MFGLGKKKAEALIKERIHADPGDTFEFIAIAYDGHGVVPNFEQSDYFKIYFYKNGKKEKSNISSLYPESTEALVKALKDMMIDKVAARNFSSKSLRELKNAGITPYMFTGGPGAALNDLRSGKLKPAIEVRNKKH